ncbi:hypothetical protein DPX16_23656 [Anabarilius grahami]|uniref:Uncharacterized protein n=1 Tax=Anabarilius grahami TaxID=495550 RepID=A0A3N0XPX7_ANAGA|nr:hypothetical protein DPX16_23656 [Anabarilius grahami]
MMMMMIPGGSRILSEVNQPVLPFCSRLSLVRRCRGLTPLVRCQMKFHSRGDGHLCPRGFGIWLTRRGRWKLSVCGGLTRVLRGPWRRYGLWVWLCSGLGMDTLQTPDDGFFPVESGGVWEVHGMMVIRPIQNNDFRVSSSYGQKTHTGPQWVSRCGAHSSFACLGPHEGLLWATHCGFAHRKPTRAPSGLAHPGPIAVLPIWPP